MSFFRNVLLFYVYAYSLIVLNMRLNKRNIFALFLAFLFFVSSVHVVGAVNNEEGEDPELIATLQAQVTALIAQVAELQAQVQKLLESRDVFQEEIKSSVEQLRLERQLVVGSRGEDVRLLQELLASDPSIYPEGLVTGYFGPLTSRAVSRIQARTGLEQVGVVGPQTLGKINQLLEEGAGKSGVVPPGLLKAPGIQKILEPEIVRPKKEETAGKKTLQVSHTYSEGQHTISGTLPLPTPCHGLDVEVSVEESGKQAEVSLSIRNHEQICIQVIDFRDFEVVFEAEEDAVINIKLDGEEVLWNQ